MASLRHGGQWIPMHKLGVPSARVNEPLYKQIVAVEDHQIELPDQPEVPKYRQKSFRQRWFGGLKLSLRAFAIVATIVLGFNVGWLLWAQHRYGVVNRFGTIQQGDCATAKMTDLLFHLAINVLSTLLLMGSNAFMQAFSGPTREELDRAHQQTKWLHIGLLSLRNLRFISVRKSFVCVLLFMSSIPFHLLYNSLIFTSLAANAYQMAIVAEDYLTGAPYNVTAMYAGSAYIPPIFVDPFVKTLSEGRSYQKLDNAECIKEYSASIISSRRNLVLVSSQADNSSNSLLDVGGPYGADDRTYFWICSKSGGDGPSVQCNPDDYINDAENWKVYDFPILYCLSEQTKDVCAVQFSLDIMIVVCVCNGAKVVAMLWVLFRFDAEKLLASSGDAMSSFMTNPDPTTVGICLVDKANIDHVWSRPRYPGPYRPQMTRWWRAASRKRWLAFVALTLGGIVLIALLLWWGVTVIKGKGISPWHLAFGTLNVNALVLADNTGNAASMSVLANAPQLILSLIYLLYNSLMSSMFIAHDFDRFASLPSGQTLMLSSPVGFQRGTWLLGVSFPCGAVNLSLSIFLHWIVSQSLFAVQINVFTPAGELDPDNHVSNCGYSPVAMVATMMGAVVMVALAIGIGRRKLPAGGPPVVATCSAAIAASCHVPPALQSDSLVYESLRWGAIRVTTGPHPAHCALMPASAWEFANVGKPVAGIQYA